jgi:MSHA biogenesis protein MshL
MTAAVLAVSGCNFVDLRPDRAAPAEYRKALEPGKPQPASTENRRFQPPPPEVADELLPDLTRGSGKGAGRMLSGERRFDISVMGSDAREFFMGLVADSDHNVIVHPDLKGNITIDLKNVTLPEVLEAVREVYGYDYKKTDAGYIIYPAELMSRLYHVDYINFVRNGRSETRVSAGQSSQLQRGGSNTGAGQTNLGGSGMGGQSGMGGYGGMGGGYGGGGESEAEEVIDCRNADQAAGSPQRSSGSSSGRNGGLPFLPGSVIATTSTSYFWKELKQALSVIVCSGAGANFVVNQQTGVIVVKAFPKQLRDVENFLEAIRREVKRQVVLEAKILEVVLKDGYQAGVDWATVIRDGQKFMIGGFGGGASVRRRRP